MRFENLEVSKRAARLSAELYQTLINLRDYGFKDQITRAGVSISSNIAEGFERTSQRECLTFLSYAKGSCGELRSQLYVGVVKEATEISAMLSSLIKTKRGFIKKDST